MKNIRLAGILILVSAVFLATPEVAGANTSCGTKEVDLADLVDPTGYPADPKAMRPLRLNTSTILIRIPSFQQDAPFPEEFSKIWPSTSITREIVTLSEGPSFQAYWLVKFSQPFEQCVLLTGWEEWHKFLKSLSTENSGFWSAYAYLVFNRNGRQEMLREDIHITLLPGVDPIRFSKEVIDPLYQANLIASSPPMDNIDHIDGFRKGVIAAKPGVFPLRLALRLAGYAGGTTSPGWVAKVRPTFIPLISALKTDIVFEKLASSGIAYELREGESLSIEQYYLPGLVVTMVIDLLKDKNGKTYLNLLTDGREFAETFFGEFSPRIEPADYDLLFPGCARTSAKSKDVRYAREIISCRFTLSVVGDFVVNRLSLRFEDSKSGKTFAATVGKKILMRVVSLRHPEQEGIIGFLPPVKSDHAEITLPKAVPSPVSPKSIESKSLGHLDERVEKWVRESMRSPVERFFERLIANPRLFLRTEFKKILLVLLVLSVFILLVFHRWFGLPSLWRTIMHSVRIATIGCRIAVIPFLFYFNPSRGLRTALVIASGKNQIWNESASSLASRWRLRFPSEPADFLTWLESTERIKLERVLGTLWLEENISMWQNRKDVGERVSVAGNRMRIRLVEVIFSPILVFFLRREIRQRESR